MEHPRAWENSEEKTNMSLSISGSISHIEWGIQRKYNLEMEYPGAWKHSEAKTNMWLSINGSNYRVSYSPNTRPWNGVPKGMKTVNKKQIHDFLLVVLSVERVIQRICDLEMEFPRACKHSEQKLWHGFLCVVLSLIYTVLFSENTTLKWSSQGHGSTVNKKLKLDFLLVVLSLI